MNKLYSVHDHWTDISKKNDVDIESIDGVIAGIKVNGEDYGGGGSEMFKIATVTLINNSNGRWSLSGGISTNNNNSNGGRGLLGGISDNNNGIDGYGFLVLRDNLYLISTIEGVSKQSTNTLQAILMPQHGEMGALYTVIGNGTPTVTGNAKYYKEEEELGMVYITGDCTITIS